MVYNTKNGAGKRHHCWKLRKGKQKTKTSFRNYLSRLAIALSTIRVARAIAVEEMFMKNLTKKYDLQSVIKYYGNFKNCLKIPLSPYTMLRTHNIG